MARTVGTAKAKDEPGVVQLRDLGVADGGGPTDLPALPPSPPALIMVHPERWGVLGGELAPLCGRLPIEGGVGNVRVVDMKRGTLSITHAIAIKERRGWRVLLPDVDGPGTSYLHSPAPGVYLTRWETAHPGSSAITTDLPGFVRWLKKHVRKGTIPDAKPYVIEGLLRRVRGEILRLQDQVRTVPSAQVDLDRALAERTVLERALAEHQPPAAPSKPVSIDDLTE